MNITNNQIPQITLNCPNIPVLSPSSKGEVPFGVFLESPVDERNVLEPEVATIRSQDMYLPNFSIREFEANFKHEVVFKNLDAEGIHLLGSCLFLEANMRSFLAGGSTADISFRQPAAITSSHRSQNFKYDPHNEYVHSVASGSRIHYLHVSYDSGHFSRLLPENESWADWLKNKISKKERIIGDRSRPLSLAQLRAIQTILDCPLSGKLGEMMLETAITQVILFQLYYLFNEQGPGPIPINNRYGDLAFELKDYLSQSYLEDHSINSLAKQFGVNTNQLMASFKRQFGKSIFEYISDLRMEYAAHLLQDKHMRVAEVARTLGYKNPNHFSTAFKRVFGVVPTDLRYQEV